MAVLKRFVGVVSAAAVVLAAMVLVRAQSPMCDPDNGGITLPSGFCALVVANDLGIARHMVAAPNGDLYVAPMARGGPGTPGTGGGGAVALRDADKDGRFEVKEVMPGESTTGIAIHNGY